LNQFDRDRVEALKDAGHKQEEIARILDFDASAISLSSTHFLDKYSLLNVC